MVTLHEVKKLQEEQDPLKRRELIEREKAMREANPEPRPQEATPEQRAALRTASALRTAEQRRILAQIGITN